MTNRQRMSECKCERCELFDELTNPIFTIKLRTIRLYLFSYSFVTLQHRVPYANFRMFCFFLRTTQFAQDCNGEYLLSLVNIVSVDRLFWRKKYQKFTFRRIPNSIIAGHVQKRLKIDYDPSKACDRMITSNCEMKMS